MMEQTKQFLADILIVDDIPWGGDDPPQTHS